jgi:endonuclease YncB( thermonuclease family)
LKLVGLCVAALLACNAWAGERCTAIDGNTLRCRKERVLIEGINAPKHGEPGAEQARQRLQRHLKSGEVVIQRKGQDRTGRTLGRLYVNGHRVTQSDLNPPKRK